MRGDPMFLAAAGLLVFAARVGPAAGARGVPEISREAFRTAVPAYPGNVIAGRPTDRSVTLSVLSNAAAQGRVVWGRTGEGPASRTAVLDLASGEPREVVLDGLAPDARYEYRVCDARTGAPFPFGDEPGSFRTRRSEGASFVFTVQADSHLDANTDVGLYRRALGNAAADGPDFHVDLGDTFMAGTHPTRESAVLQYEAQRYHLGLIGRAAAIFLAVGNHDGEETFRPGTTGAGGLAAWACLQRNRFFPNPAPDGFYTGNGEPRPGAGLPRNYYAWTWGDALFVVLDPYWTSGGTHGGRDPWKTTIGAAQYAWLARTLRNSTARQRFLFIHQLTGSAAPGGRGGAEAARLHEWGGRDAGGADVFALRRTGWEKPIHSLLVETGVSIVFHGHDHLFAREDLDGVVYQAVPQPGCRGTDQPLRAAAYGYRGGVVRGGSGHLRVAVSPRGANVAYVRSILPPDEAAGLRNGDVACSYTLTPREPAGRRAAGD